MTLSIDVKSVFRKRKSAKRVARLVPRPRHQLPELTSFTGCRALVLLPDTNVYIGRAAGRLPPSVRDAIDQALLFHCSVALAELAVGIANANPLQPGWAALQDHYIELFANIRQAGW